MLVLFFSIFNLSIKHLYVILLHASLSKMPLGIPVRRITVRSVLHRLLCEHGISSDHVHCHLANTQLAVAVHDTVAADVPAFAWSVLVNQSFRTDHITPRDGLLQ